MSSLFSLESAPPPRGSGGFGGLVLSQGQGGGPWREQPGPLSLPGCRGGAPLSLAPSHPPFPLSDPCSFTPGLRPRLLCAPGVYSAGTPRGPRHPGPARARQPGPRPHHVDADRLVLSLVRPPAPGPVAEHPPQALCPGPGNRGARGGTQPHQRPLPASRNRLPLYGARTGVAHPVPVAPVSPSLLTPPFLLFPSFPSLSSLSFLFSLPTPPLPFPPRPHSPPPLPFLFPRVLHWFLTVVEAIPTNLVT